MKKFASLIALIFFVTILNSQNLYTDVSLAENIPEGKNSKSTEEPVKDNASRIPSDLDVVNLLGSCEITDLNYTLDTLGLDFKIIDHEEDRYFIDIAGAEHNIKPWEIATTKCGDGKEKITYVLVRYFHENDGDLVDLERYNTKRSKKINDRKFIYNKSVGRQQSYFAVQITD